MREYDTKKFHRLRNLPYVFAVLISFGLHGCDPFTRAIVEANLARAAIPTTKNSEKYEALCRENAGTKIFETVSGVRGILDESSKWAGCSYCEDGLLNVGYEFVEYEVTETTTGRDWTFVDGNGLYRYTLQNAGSPDCRLFYKFYERWEKAGNGIPKKYRGQCIATKIVGKVRSKYKVKLTASPNTGSFEQDQITFRKTIFSNLDETKIYAQHMTYYYRPVSDYKSPISGMGFGFSCPKSSDKDYLRPNLGTIFKPSRAGTPLK